MSSNNSSTEQVKQDAAENAKSAASAFDSSGSIGKQFTTEGAIGGTAQQVGGPFDKDGMIGKQFKEDGSIGGTAQQMLGDQGKQ